VRVKELVGTVDLSNCIEEAEAVPPQNPVNGAIVDVSALGVQLTYPDASLAVPPARNRQIESPDGGKVIALPMVGGLHHRYARRSLSESLGPTRRRA